MLGDNPVARLRQLPLNELKRRVSVEGNGFGILAYAAALGVTGVLRWGYNQDFIGLSENVLFLMKPL